MTNGENDRQPRDERRGNRPFSFVDKITLAGGVIIAAVVIVAAVNSLSNGESGLGWTLVAGGILACTGPLINIFWSRNRRRT